MAVESTEREFDPAADTAAWQAFVVADEPEPEPRRSWVSRLLARVRR